ncbi:MAG: hypothetical protein FJ284_07625 [Planctomycetes bacterium]|nr:hypothetical protein [Planctomycetota bacterium]
MPIALICPGCKARFSVSDQFAGRTGPCPKCKQPIKVPEVAVKSVVIHEPDRPVATSAGTGRPPTAPLKSRDRPVPLGAFLATAVAAVVSMGIAFLLPTIFPPVPAGGETPAKTGIPSWLLLLGAFAVAVPTVRLGYAAVRNRELEPYRGRPLLLRTLACAAVYAILWGVRGLIPAEQTAEMWQWIMLGPLFVAAGGLAALATLDLEPGPAGVHFSFYVLFTALLRWLCDLAPL